MFCFHIFNWGTNCDLFILISRRHLIVTVDNFMCLYLNIDIKRKYACTLYGFIECCDFCSENLRPNICFTSSLEYTYHSAFPFSYILFLFYLRFTLNISSQIIHNNTFEHNDGLHFLIFSYFETE